MFSHRFDRVPHPVWFHLSLVIRPPLVCEVCVFPSLHANYLCVWHFSLFSGFSSSFGAVFCFPRPCQFLILASSSMDLFGLPFSCFEPCRPHHLWRLPNPGTFVCLNNLTVKILTLASGSGHCHVYSSFPACTSVTQVTLHGVVLRYMCFSIRSLKTKMDPALVFYVCRPYTGCYSTITLVQRLGWW